MRPAPLASLDPHPAAYFRRAATRIGRSAFAASAAFAISAAPSAPVTSAVIHSIVSVISPIPLRVAAAQCPPIQPPRSNRTDRLASNVL